MSTKPCLPIGYQLDKTGLYNSKGELAYAYNPSCEEFNLEQNAYSDLLSYKEYLNSLCIEIPKDLSSDRFHPALTFYICSLQRPVENDSVFPVLGFVDPELKLYSEVRVQTNVEYLYIDYQSWISWKFAQLSLLKMCDQDNVPNINELINETRHVFRKVKNLIRQSNVQK